MIRSKISSSGIGDSLLDLSKLISKRLASTLTMLVKKLIIIRFCFKARLGKRVNSKWNKRVSHHHLFEYRSVVDFVNYVNELVNIKYRKNTILAQQIYVFGYILWGSFAPFVYLMNFNIVSTSHYITSKFTISKLIFYSNCEPKLAQSFKWTCCKILMLNLNWFWNLSLLKLRHKIKKVIFGTYIGCYQEILVSIFLYIAALQ